MSHISKYGSFINRVVLLPFVLLSLSLIQACGLPGEAGGTSGQSNDELGSGPAQAATGEPERFKGLILNVERLNGQKDLSGGITFVSLDENGRETDFSIPQYNIEYSKEAENTLLRINETDYIENVNHVVKMTFGSGETYYTFIPPTEPMDNDTKVTEHVTANIFSHYAVLKFIETINSAAELDSLRPCIDGGALINCTNQPKAKQILLYNLASLAAGFDFDFEDNVNVATAISVLESNAEFNQLVQKSISEVILTTEEAEAILIASQKESLKASDVDTAPIARGTFRSTALGTDLQGTQLNFNTTISEVYNSVYFNIAVGAPTNNANTTISATTSTIFDDADNDNALPVYPRYYKNNTMANMRYESALTIDIPTIRQILTIEGGLNADNELPEVEHNTDSTDGTVVKNINSGQIFDSFISTQGNILDSRLYTQNLPQNSEEGESGLEGRSLSPTFSKMYFSNNYEPPAVITSIDSNDEAKDYGYEPTWLTSANLNQETISTIDNFKLDNQTVTDNTHNHFFSWEVHGLETDSDFSISSLDDKQYGAISFGIKLNNTDKVVELIGDVMHWSTSSKTITATQPTNPSDFYQSHYLSLDKDGTANTVTNKRGEILSSRPINTLETTTANTDHSGGVTLSNKGLLMLDQGSEAPIGHSTQSGDYLTFSFNTNDVEADENRGAGIIIASTVSDQTPTTRGAQWIYQLQGNSLTIEKGKNTYRNWNGSTLKISSDTAGACNATLHLESLSVVQTIEEDRSEIGSSVFESASEPLNNDRSYTYDSTACTVLNSTITMEFEDVYKEISTTDEGEDTSNNDLVLKGFLSKSGSDTDTESQHLFGNLMTLLWQQADTLGLILGHKEQLICPHFDDQITSTKDPRCSN